MKRLETNTVQYFYTFQIKKSVTDRHWSLGGALISIHLLTHHIPLLFLRYLKCILWLHFMLQVMLYNGI